MTLPKLKEQAAKEEYPQSKRKRRPSYISLDSLLTETTEDRQLYLNYRLTRLSESKTNLFKAKKIHDYKKRHKEDQSCLNISQTLKVLIKIEIFNKTVHREASGKKKKKCRGTKIFHKQHFPFLNEQKCIFHTAGYLLDLRLQFTKGF